MNESLKLFIRASTVVRAQFVPIAIGSFTFICAVALTRFESASTKISPSGCGFCAIVEVSISAKFSVRLAIFPPYADNCQYVESVGRLPVVVPFAIYELF